MRLYLRSRCRARRGGGDGARCAASALPRRVLVAGVLCAAAFVVAAPVAVAGERLEWRSLIGFVGDDADAAAQVAASVVANATVVASDLPSSAVQGGGPTGWEMFETAPLDEDGKVLWSDKTRTTAPLRLCPPLMAEEGADDPAMCVFQGGEEAGLEAVGGKAVVVEAAWFVDEREGSDAAEMARFPLFNCTLGGALRLLEDSDVAVSVVLLTPARAEEAPYPAPEGDFSWKVPRLAGEKSRAVVEALPPRTVKTTALVAGQEALRMAMAMASASGRDLEVEVVERLSSGRSTMEAFGPFSGLGISLTAVAALLNALASAFLVYKLGAFIYALGFRHARSLTSLCMLLTLVSRLGSLIRCLDPTGVWNVVDGWFWPFFITWPFSLSVIATMILSIIWHRQLQHALSVADFGSGRATEEDADDGGCCVTSSGRQITPFEIVAWVVIALVVLGESISTITSTVNRTTTLATSALTAIPPLIACGFVSVAGFRVLSAAGATRRWSRMGGLILFIAATTAVFIPLLMMVLFFNLDAFSAANQRGIWINLFVLFYLQTIQSFAVGATFTTPTRAGFQRHRKFVAQLNIDSGHTRDDDFTDDPDNTLSGSEDSATETGEASRESRTTERLLQYAIDMSAFDTFDDLDDADLFDSRSDSASGGARGRRHRSGSGGGDHSLE